MTITAEWSPTPAELLTARLDRLPMTRTMWVLAFLVSLGGFFDALALELTATVAPGLFHDKIITPTTSGLFGTSGLAGFIAALFAGMFIGTILFSYVADHFGRRAIFAYSLLWFGIANFIMALPDHRLRAELLAFRQRARRWPRTGHGRCLSVRADSQNGPRRGVRLSAGDERHRLPGDLFPVLATDPDDTVRL